MPLQKQLRSFFDHKIEVTCFQNKYGYICQPENSLGTYFASNIYSSFDEAVVAAQYRALLSYCTDAPESMAIICPSSDRVLAQSGVSTRLFGNGIGLKTVDFVTDMQSLVDHRKNLRQQGWSWTKQVVKNTDGLQFVSSTYEQIVPLQQKILFLAQTKLDW